TAGVTGASLLAAARAAGKSLEEMKVAFLGAGSAGCGIAEQLIRLMVGRGLTDEQARKQVFMVDRDGLVNDSMEGLRAFQQKLVHRCEDFADWGCEGNPGLLEVVTHARPDAIVGVSGQPGLFTREVIEKMAANHERPIIFPLSNPVSQVEATPEDIIGWTEGRALIATGSPFEPVEFNGNCYPIAQCNNIYIFPGLGLGVLASGAERVSDGMLDAAVETLAMASSGVMDPEAPLLPLLDRIQQVTCEIAMAVARQAQKDGLAPDCEQAELELKVRAKHWSPEYRRIHMADC
ncbi:MAG: oxaloacetate-decarboxylating malate dehydrogenase, partial [Endozoicomonas sp.]